MRCGVSITLTENRLEVLRFKRFDHGELVFSFAHATVYLSCLIPPMHVLSLPLDFIRFYSLMTALN